MELFGGKTLSLEENIARLQITKPSLIPSPVKHKTKNQHRETTTTTTTNPRDTYLCEVPLELYNMNLILSWVVRITFNLIRFDQVVCQSQGLDISFCLQLPLK